MAAGLIIMFCTQNMLNSSNIPSCKPVACISVPCVGIIHNTSSPPISLPIESTKNTLRTQRKILINYGQGCCERSQPLNCRTGLEFGFDECKSYNLSALDQAFKERYQEILTQKRGGGYWLWKPYIIFKTMMESEENDFIFYADSGSFWVNYFTDVLEWSKDHEIIPFKNDLSYECLERNFTKRDTYVILNADNRTFN